MTDAPRSRMVKSTAPWDNVMIYVLENIVESEFECTCENTKTARGTQLCIFEIALNHKNQSRHPLISVSRLVF